MTKAIFKNGLELDVIIEDGNSYLLYNNEKYYANFEIKDDKPALSLYNIAEELDFIPKNLLKNKVNMFVEISKDITEELKKSKEEKIEKENNEKRARGLKKAIIITNRNDWDRISEVWICAVYPATKEEIEKSSYKEEYKVNLHFRAFFEVQHKVDFKDIKEIDLEKLEHGFDGNADDIYFINEEIENKLFENYKNRKQNEENEKQRIKEEKEKAKKEHYEKCLVEAKEKNERIVLYQISDECNDPREECDIDTITTFLYPDGREETIRSHTW